MILSGNNQTLKQQQEQKQTQKPSVVESDWEPGLIQSAKQQEEKERKKKKRREKATMTDPKVQKQD